MNNTFATFAKDLIVEADEPKYGCLMAIISPQISAVFTEWAFDHIDPDDVIPANGKPGYEDEPHITVLYGFHEDVTAEEVFAVVGKIHPLRATLKQISAFKQEDQDVIKVDVESQDLCDLNALLAEKFKDRYTNKFPEYLPHMTLAYTVPGVIDGINKDAFQGLELAIDLLTYSYPKAEEKKVVKLTEVRSRQIPQKWNIENVYFDGNRVSATRPVPSPSADGALAKFIWLMLSELEQVTRETISRHYKKAKEIGGYKITKVGADAPREHPEPTNNFSHFPPAPDKPRIKSPTQLALWGEDTAKISLPEFVDKAFNDLAEDQRCDPESAMLEVSVLTTGMWGWALEHIGDLTHRMAQHPNFYQGGGEYVAEKVRRGLRYLTNPYGFAKEVGENMLSNYKYKGEGMSFDQYMKLVRQKAQIYWQAHEKLVVYNRAQWLGRQAAICIGQEKFDQAVIYLREIQKHLDSDWSTFALEYKLDSNGNLLPYTSVR